MPSFSCPVLGLAAYSGVGKTTLLIHLLPMLRQHGVRPAVLKHSHHPCEIDKPGKDSYMLHHAGAVQTLIASANRTVLRIRHTARPNWEESVHRLGEEADLILLEGYKAVTIPKLELHRPRLGHPLLCAQDSNIIAVATDEPLAWDLSVPLLELNDPSMIADFIVSWLNTVR
ncbi:MAG: molybdopterin-guanine dinucleotide biosynthesis protein B [Candidatus Competibacteraceae bacterium]|nr:molybdopterin-guanine dinucleotide biosynthesis protein B [Candidatus Competibacteraceae bacterium]